MQRKYSKTDQYIAFAVLLQSFLVILQQVLISVFHMPPEATTIYRVVLTAIPLSVAIAITIYRKWNAFLIVYSIAILILLLHIIIFPDNYIYIKQNSLRFLLPIVIPNVLCLMYLKDISIVESALYKISWFTAFLALIYVVNFFSGRFLIESYSMSLSYGLLLPMLSLYSDKRWYSILAALFLFIIVISIGSRGAAIVFLLYVVYDTFQYNKKYIIPSIIAIVVFFLFLPSLATWLDTIGISSRTLNLLLGDEIGYMSGRDTIYDNAIAVFWSNPIKGVGLFGDRVFMNGHYVHNFILELYLNWGIIVATLILFYFGWKFISTYIKSDKKNRNTLVKYLFAGVAPLMASGSYLIDYDLGVFIGVLFLISRQNKVKEVFSAKKNLVSNKSMRF